ncbi:RAD51-associated protein 2 [Rana temporaria]|uniref:RAD51-associated protein 2 n=1 Tax=Rana temporaria TaxID=8407 RepID=UPI001AAE175A|nr:RAD51-associated protein 2 [Rana temporaria]
MDSGLRTRECTRKVTPLEERFPGGFPEAGKSRGIPDDVDRGHSVQSELHCGALVSYSLDRNPAVLQKVSDMNREEQSYTEMIRIWPGQRERTRTIQSQQLQLGTNRGTSGAITAQTKEEAICQPINAHNPCSAMCYKPSTTSHAEMKIEKQQRFYKHNGNEASALPFKVVGLSLENIIVSQTDIIWESYIVAAYKTNRLYGRLAYADISTVDGKNVPSFALIQKERQFHARNNRLVAAKSSRRPCFKESIHAMKEIRDWEKASKIDNQRPFKRKLSVTLKETEEVSAKQASYNFSKSCDTPDLSMHVSENEVFGGSKMFYGHLKNSDKCLEFDQTTGSTDLCSVAKIYPVKQFYSEEASSSLRKVNTPQICDCTRDGYETCSVKCRLRSVLKDSFLGEIDVFTSIFIPETDSTVDYTVPYTALTQKGHCKAQTYSEESFFLKMNTYSRINPHDSLSLYPQMTSNVIFNKGDDKPIKSQRQVVFEWASHEKSTISASMLISCSVLQKTDLSFIDKKNCHFGSNLFLSTKMSFPALLNHHRKCKKQYFLPNISTSADSFIGMPINDFAYSQNRISEVGSFPQNELQILQHFAKANGVEAKQMEMEVTLGEETMFKTTESAHLAYATALKNQDFCFPSHLLDAAENSEEDTLKRFTEANWMQSYPEPVFHEMFGKIGLDMYTVELQNDNSAEANCLLQNQALSDSSIPMESEFRSGRKECYGSATLHFNELGVSDADRKVCKKEVQSVYENKEIVHNFLQDSTMHDTYFCENSIQNEREPKRSDIIFKNKSKTEEHSESLKLNLSNEEINLKNSCFPIDTANGFPSGTILNVVTKAEYDNINELQVEGICSFENTEKSHCNLKDANYSLEGNSAIGVTNPSAVELAGLTLHAFEMKAQFDLVLEELKLFHSIGQTNENPFISDNKKGIEQMCSTSVELPDILTEDLPCESIMDSNDCGLNDQTLIQVREQEVPQASCSASSGDEESLYSTVKGGNTTKTVLWTPSFIPYGERTIVQHIDKELLRRSKVVIIAVLSIVRNALVCWAVVINRTLKNGTNYVLILLSVADIKVGLLAFLFTISFKTDFHRCLLLACLVLVLTQSSIFDLTIDGYLAIKTPLRSVNCGGAQMG